MSEEVLRSARALESKLGTLQHYDLERIGRIEYGGEAWPLLCVTSKEGAANRPAVLISGGVHGDEPAGVHAALAFLADRQPEFHDAFRFVVFPCVNPSGFDSHTLHTRSGANLNRLFGTGSAQPEVRAIEGWLERHAIRFLMTFDLHEVRPDYVGEGFVEKDNPRAAYLYETVTGGSQGLGRMMIDALPPHLQVCDWPTIYQDVNRGGVISYPEGLRNPVYEQGTAFDAFLARHYTPHSFTLETPTGWTMSDRVEAHLTFVKTALRHTVRLSVSK